jgi:hypothetical protein
VGYTTDREFTCTRFLKCVSISWQIVRRKRHPAPKVFIWLSKLYPAEHKLHNQCRWVFYSSVRFYDAIDRADTDALGRISMTLALDTGGLIDHIGDAIAFADGLGGAFRYASAAGDAIFGNFHCHGR